MHGLTRRAFLHTALRAMAPHTPGLTLGFSTYGMPALTTARALREIAAIGFDSVELAILPDRDAAPARLDATRRKEIRNMLRDLPLRLTALMENLTPSPRASTHREALDRLARAADLAHDLAPDRLPLVETVLGGGSWDRVRTLFRDRLGDWVRVLAARRIVLAIKPHRFGAMSLPEEAVWLIRQLHDTPWLRLAFDASHYLLRGRTLESLVDAAAGCTGFVAVKDVVMREGKAVFELPGETGTQDYPALFGLLAKAGYRGDINCEVSGMVSARRGYDASAAARLCYRNMAAALKVAKLRSA
ncbi:MAG: sugar phosphate isomerase/epimerase family protein [Gemmataceae bacterium]